jgi:hypothetical protein
MLPLRVRRNDTAFSNVGSPPLHPSIDRSLLPPMSSRDTGWERRGLCWEHQEETSMERREFRTGIGLLWACLCRNRDGGSWE